MISYLGMSAPLSLFESFRSFFVTRRLSPPAAVHALRLPEPQKTLKADSDNAISASVIEKQYDRGFDKVLPCYTHQVMYLNQDAYLLERPMKCYDSKILTLSYGDAVIVAAFQGNYANVQTNKYTGWVDKDVLSSRKEEVWPTWAYNTWCDATHETTLKVRALLKDMFFAGATGLPLQPAEYISVVLREDNRDINWPVALHRVPGCWHQLLRGVTGIHISVHATTDSIMEWTDGDGISHLAYVNEVRPDKTMRLSGVGIFDEGILESILVPSGLWREWRPIFIEIT